MNSELCARCGRYRAVYGDNLCSRCRYKAHYEWMLAQPSDDQNWEFATCPECGSSFDSDGHCINTFCGNSPYQGQDWL